MGSFGQCVSPNSVGILPNMGVRELASLDLEAHGDSCYGALTVPDFCPVSLVHSSTPVTLE